MLLTLNVSMQDYKSCDYYYFTHVATALLCYLAEKVNYFFDSNLKTKHIFVC